MQRRQSFHHAGALAVAMALPAWVGCTSSQPLKLGIHAWIGYETIHLAHDFKWLPGSVQLENFPDISETARALELGHVDAACLTLDDVLRIRAKGVGLTVALVFDVSAGADAVLVQPRIRTPADLAGKRIGVEPSALGALMLGGLLKTARLRKHDVTLVELSPVQQLQAWQSGEVDALICYEPNTTLLQRMGARRIFDSRQMPDTILDVLAVRLDRAGRRDDALHATVNAHFRGLAHLKFNRQDAVYRIAARQGMSPGEVQSALGGVVLPTLEANRQYLSSTQGRLIPAAQSVSHLMVEDGLLAHDDPMISIGNGTWLPDDDA
jgi:NitT/TauT family transport system substrate-binding protein